MNLWELIVDRGQRFGGKNYLFYREEEVTFEELLLMVRKLADGLFRVGVSRGEKVCLWMENRPEFIYLFFAVTSVGAVLVPVNPRYTLREVEYIIQHSEACSLMVSDRFATMARKILPACPLLKRLIGLGTGENPPLLSYESLMEQGNSRFQPPPIRADDDAGIIYTSGTTGKPKGVIITHHNYVINARMGSEGKKMDPQTRVLTCLPLVHVNAQVSSLLSSLYAGGSLVLLEAFHPKEFIPSLARYRATTFAGVPTMYAILLNTPDLDRYDLSALTYCISGGAPMSPDLLISFEKAFNCRILEAYGLTEATALVSTNPPDNRRKIGSLGMPYKGIEMKIFDEADRELPRGQGGEIVVRGENVMKGYFKDPSATAQALRGGWLHTGDMGYEDQDGFFFLAGRKKEMIIRGGVNIYPREIEEVLKSHPMILEAAVIGPPDPIWGERVHACLIFKEGQGLTLQEVQAFCKERLADFKIPATISFHKEFPLTGANKVQKPRLLEMVMKGKG